MPLDRHVRCVLPQPVFDSPDRERVPGAWLSHETPAESVMMQVPGIGEFVRALLPVRFAGGHTVTFGVWLELVPGELQRIFAVWWAPEYADLRIKARLANSIKPWGLLGAPVEAVVRDVEETPYCVRSTDPELDRVLHDEWPRDPLVGQ
jgi:hypothetical protein